MKRALALSILLLGLAAKPTIGAAQQPPPAAMPQAPQPAVQQASQAAAPQGPHAGIEFQLATDFLSPNDSRISGGSNIFRLQFRPAAGPNIFMFYERIGETFSFKNGGSTASSTGESQMDGVGLGMGFGPTRLELMTGRATTTIPGAGAPAGTTLTSSDSVVDLGFFYTYRPAVQGAFIDAGLVYRQQKLTSGLPGTTIIGGSTQTKSVDDLGGVIVRLGIGYGF